MLASAGATATITQTVQVATDLALTMFEIHARRGKGAKLHNFGAFPSRHDAAGRIVELWMVDALPGVQRRVLGLRGRPVAVYRAFVGAQRTEGQRVIGRTGWRA